MNDTSFESELQNTFLTEAEEMLEDTEMAFVAIETTPNDTTMIDKIFRLVHSIKGSAHVAGFSQLGQFAHIFETLLGAMREKKISASAEIVDILLESNDRLKEFVRALRANPAAEIDVSRTEARIKAALDGGVETPTRPTIKEVAPPAPVVEARTVPASDPIATKSDRVPKTHESGVATFLLVEDETDILSTLEMIFVDEGYRVITCTDARKAIEIFKDEKIDAVITDLNMPGMNGVEFVTAIREVNMFVSIAVISGYSTREHIKAFLALGVDSFLDKPFRPDEIVAVGQRLVRESNLRSSMLTLSKLSFRTYLMMAKILATLPPDASSCDDRQLLDRCMEGMRGATIQLLASERALKKK